jgi:hypothetical protein
MPEVPTDERIHSGDARHRNMLFITARSVALVALAARRLDRRRLGGEYLRRASEPLAVQPQSRSRYSALPILPRMPPSTNRSRAATK